MIKFFRKIRQNLLNENRFTKYLIYAIGEIILVVIGILIALQINIWNEKIELKEIEKHYINRLVEDLLKDSVYFKDVRKYANNLLNEYQVYTNNSYKIQNTYEDFHKLLCCIDFPPTELSIHKTTYLELLSTGRLSIIQSDYLREEIGNHYQLFEKHNRHLIEFDSYANIVLGNLDNKIPMAKHLASLSGNLPNYEQHMLDNGNWQYINNPQSIEFLAFENTVASYHHKFKTMLTYLSDIENSTNNLLNELRIINDKAQ